MFKVLQAGRGLGALGVAAFHLSLVIQDRWGMPAWFMDAMEFGRHRVEFFFALSGFLILHSHWKDCGRSERVNSFGLKRIARIYPLYWLSLILVGVLGYMRHDVAPESWGSIVSNIVLFKFVDEMPPNVPTWTLFHEILFYVLFSTLIINRAFGSVVLCLWIFAIFCLGGAPSEYEHSAYHVATSPINLCFFGGMLAFFIYERIPAGQVPLLTAAGACTIGAALFLFDEDRQPLLFFGTMSTGIALFFAGLIGLERLGKTREIRILTLLGNASYSIYLFHMVILLALLKMAQATGAMNYLGSSLAYMLVMLGVLGAAYALHLYVERPLNRAVNHWLGFKKRAVTEDNGLARPN